jgi:hypothetical protein
MTSIVFPSILQPSDASWGLRGLTQRHVSPLDGTEQTLEMPGARWSASLSWRTLSSADSRTLSAWLNALRGSAGRFRFGPYSAVTQRLGAGAATRTNWLNNGQFSGASVGVLPTGWEFAAGAGVTMAIAGTGTDGNGTYVDVTFSGTPSTATVGIFRITAASTPAAASGQVWTASAKLQTQGTVTNISFCRAGCYDVTSGPAYSISSLGSELASALSSPTTVQVTRTLANVRVGMGIDVRTAGSGSPIALTLRIWTPQLERRASASAYIATTSGPASAADTVLVNGASQSGSTLSTRAWAPAVEAMKAGDFLSYTDTGGRARLHQATADVTSTEAGVAAIPITPPIRRAGADGATVEIAAPYGFFRLADDMVPIAVRPGVFGSVSFGIEEALA